MKMFILSTTTFFIFSLTNGQTDSLLLKRYEQLILENNNIKSDLIIEINKFKYLSSTYAKDIHELRTQLNDLQKELQKEQQKVSNLNKNKLTLERDQLLITLDSMNTLIIKQEKYLTDKNKQIEFEKENTITKAEAAKKDGKKETLESIMSSYKNRSFDDLVNFLSLESVTRDMKIIGNNPEVEPILSDLSIFFSAKELLSEKFDAHRINNAQNSLNKIKQHSNLLEDLKENLDNYKDFNSAFKETISLIMNLDRQKLSAGDSDIQKLKFKEIGNILINYMYNYYNFGKYPFLTEILLDIIKTKKLNADADISHLLEKLE